MKYSVVIPVYNTVQPLKELVEDIRNAFTDLAAESEIILVEDCSPNPDTWDMIRSLASNYTEVTGIQLSRNFGQHPATMCGLAEATGDFVITLDDDLQHNPEDIPKLLEHKGHDIVIGEFPQKKHSLFKRISSYLKGYFDTLLIGKPRHIRLSSFRLINRATVDGMLSINTANPFIPALMFYVSKDVVGVPLEHHQRAEGNSNYTLIRLFRMFNNLIIGNSSVLLRAIGILGVATALISIVYAGVIVVRQLLNPALIPGWTSVMVSILFFGGLLLFSMGVIGEYLIRIIAAVESRPGYMIRQRVKQESGETDQE